MIIELRFEEHMDGPKFVNKGWIGPWYKNIGAMCKLFRYLGTSTKTLYIIAYDLNILTLLCIIIVLFSYPFKQ